MAAITVARYRSTWTRDTKTYTFYTHTRHGQTHSSQSALFIFSVVTQVPTGHGLGTLSAHLLIYAENKHTDNSDFGQKDNLACENPGFMKRLDKCVRNTE